MVVSGGLTNSCEKKRSEGKGEKESYAHLNAEFQRTAGRDKKAFLSEQYKEIEENNRRRRLEMSSRKLEITRVLFIQIPKEGNAKECSNYHTIAFISHASKVMLKILQARLQQYMNCELPDVQSVQYCKVKKKKKE